MGLHGECQSIRAYIGLECCVDLTDQFRESTLIHPCIRAFVMSKDHFDPHKLLGRREARCPHGSVQLDLVERSPNKKRSHLRSLSQGTKRTYLCCCCRTKVTLERPHQRSVARALFKRTPDAEDQSSPRHQRAVHL